MPFSNPGSSPVALAEIAAAGRTYPALTQVISCRFVGWFAGPAVCWQDPPCTDMANLFGLLLAGPIPPQHR
jgi:hypothetical protein